MKWSDETVEEVAEAIRFRPNIWAEGTRETALEALAAVAECNEVKALVKAALGLLKAVGPLPDENGSGKAYIVLKNALIPFTEASNE